VLHLTCRWLELSCLRCLNVRREQLSTYHHCLVLCQLHSWPYIRAARYRSHHVSFHTNVVRFVMCLILNSAAKTTLGTDFGSHFHLHAFLVESLYNLEFYFVPQNIGVWFVKILHPLKTVLKIAVLQTCRIWKTIFLNFYHANCFIVNMEFLCLRQFSATKGIMYSGCSWIVNLPVYLCIPNIISIISWKVSDIFSLNFQHWWWILGQECNISSFASKGQSSSSLLGSFCWKMHF